MKKQIILLAVMLLMSVLTKAQTVIGVSIDQNPPLTVIAETVMIGLPAGGLNAGSDISVEGGDGRYTYIWTDGDGRILGTERTLLITVPGDYYLRVADGNGCQVSTRFTATATDGIAVLDGKRPVSQLRIVAPSGLLVKKITLPDLNSAENYGLQPGIYLFTYVHADGTATVRRTLIK
ncbi:MAG: hypothetical protein K6A82_04205 [Prevotella sp.]|nr:hypothetical protein [Prevotella sp.]